MPSAAALVFLACLPLGAGAGFLAGLLGVGGGLVIVPVLLYLFAYIGVAAQIQPHLALGTSLASILFTSIFSFLSHHRHGAVDWGVFRAITPGIVTGALAGAWAAGYLPAQPLKVFFVVFLFFAATQMLLNLRPPPQRALPGRGGMFAAGNIIGAVSSWVGIGGGTLSVPFLAWCNVPVPRAIGTSAAIGFPIAAAGALGYALSGWGQADLPAASLGYLHLPALAGIAATSVLTAPLGARLTHRLPVARLKRIFALLLLILAIRMAVSVF